MSLQEEVLQILGKPEGINLEYKAVLPPSRTIAQILSAFANSEGGYLILGVLEGANGFHIKGLSEDFHANSLTHRALDLITPRPIVSYEYITHNGKKLYAIKTEKSDKQVSLEGKIFVRKGASVVLSNAVELNFKPRGFERVKAINEIFKQQAKIATNSKSKLIEHYQGVLKIIDDFGSILYPQAPNQPTTVQEGKILTRILYSSCVDNFETYLSDILYEIYLAKPETLKSKQEVTIEEVLNCSDLQDFVRYWAKQKILRLQKGSVKGFIKDNRQISDLKVFDEVSENEIEKILQIRHLYSHRNGIVDEKFLQYFSNQFVINSEHQLSISEVCDKLSYLAEIVEKVDSASVKKYSLAASR